MAASASRPGRVALFVALVILIILAIVDLSSPRSVLRDAWRSVFPTETKGERMRDNIMDRVRPPGP